MPEAVKTNRETPLQGIAGTYALRLKIGDLAIPSDPTMLRYLKVTASIDRMVPTFELALTDAFGALTHLLPADNQSNTFTIGLGTTNPVQDSLVFDLYQRLPFGENVNQAVWLVHGMLKVAGMFSPTRSRTFRSPATGTIASTPKTVKALVEDMATEMGILHDVSPDLDSIIENIYQPDKTNAWMLSYLKTTLQGVSGKNGFYAFVVPTETKPKLMFQSHQDLTNQKVWANFAYNDLDMGDRKSAYNLQVVDSYALLRDRGTAAMGYGFYDYFNGEYVSKKLTLTDLTGPSLSEHYLVNKTDPETGFLFKNLGRVTEYTQVDEFRGEAMNTYLKRVNSLVQAWIDVDGDASLWPGLIVDLYFPAGDETPLSYQYNGAWLVSRVVHQWSGIYTTRLLLTRPGVNSDKKNTFVTPARVYGRV